MGRPRLDISDTEREARVKESKRRYKERLKQQKQQASEKQSEKQKADMLRCTDPATTAAIINERHEYSRIIAYHKFKNRITICEHMKFYEDSQPFRVKVTVYESFSSRADAVSWMREHGCKSLQEF